MRVDDQARNLVLLVGNERLIEERAQRQIGQTRSCAAIISSMLAAASAGQHVAGAQRRRLRHQRP